jgi:hypothetical protein
VLPQAAGDNATARAENRIAVETGNLGRPSRRPEGMIRPEPVSGASAWCRMGETNTAVSPGTTSVDR